MKKLITIVILMAITCIFAQDWYNSMELLPEIKRTHAAKDTTWAKYYPVSVYIADDGENWDRAVRFDVHDFGLEYPVNLHAVTADLHEEGYAFDYTIYDEDGSTVLFLDIILRYPDLMTIILDHL